MADHSNPDLIKVTEIFLVPSSFLVAALGTADTNPHRAAVSLVGLTVSTLWWICSREALSDLVAQDSGGVASHLRRRTRILPWLAVIFVSGWLISVIIHGWLWNQPLST